NLDGHLLVDDLVASRIHDAHATLAEDALDAVTAVDGLADVRVLLDDRGRPAAGGDVDRLDVQLLDTLRWAGGHCLDAVNRLRALGHDSRHSPIQLHARSAQHSPERLSHLWVSKKRSVAFFAPAPAGCRAKCGETSRRDARARKIFMDRHVRGRSRLRPP